MRVLELHFNPKNKRDNLCESFVYEPENVFEKRLGSLYISGELKNPLPQDANFLKNLSLVLKGEYYNAGLKKTIEASFEDALKKSNEFLEEISRKGNVGWLGNLSFIALNFQNFILTFAKVGDIKIMLQRDGELTDIGQNLEFQDIEPYPLKVFSNVAVGKLAQNDQIMIATEDVFSALSRKGDLLGRLSRVNKEGELKEFLKENRQSLGEASGLCMLLTVSEDLKLKESVNFQQEGPKFSFRDDIYKPTLAMFAPAAKKINKVSLLFSLKIPQIKFEAKVFKKTAPVILLAIILIAIFLIFNKEKQTELAESEQKLSAAQEKITMAESLLILKQEEKAKILFGEASDVLASLIKNKGPLQAEARVLQESIESYANLRNP